MNITWMQGFWIVWGICFVLLGLVVWQANEAGSERTKRVELEAQIAEHACPVDTVFIGLGDNRIWFSPVDSAGQWLSPDSLLAVPPKDTTLYNYTNEIIHRLAKGWYEGSDGVDSSEETE